MSVCFVLQQAPCSELGVAFPVGFLKHSFMAGRYGSRAP
jgi:hypothetical protein